MKVPFEDECLLSVGLISISSSSWILYGGADEVVSKVDPGTRGASTVSMEVEALSAMRTGWKEASSESYEA